MNIQSIATLPLPGMAYALTAVGCAGWAILKKTNNLLWPLSGLILSIAGQNTCVEEWATLKRVPLESAMALLILLFVFAYRSFCLRLIERTGLRPVWIKEQYAFLVLVYVGVAVIGLLAVRSSSDENPPYVLFIFVAFVCALHVPTFAYGSGLVKQFVVRSGMTAPQSAPDISWSFIVGVTVMLGVPFMVALFFQPLRFDDYRLPSADAVMTAVLVSLLIVSRFKR
jgi:hypothetical protein